MKIIIFCISFSGILKSNSKTTSIINAARSLSFILPDFFNILFNAFFFFKLSLIPRAHSIFSTISNLLLTSSNSLISKRSLRTSEIIPRPHLIASLIFPCSSIFQITDSIASTLT